MKWCDVFYVCCDVLCGVVLCSRMNRQPATDVGHDYGMTGTKTSVATLQHLLSRQELDNDVLPSPYSRSHLYSRLPTAAALGTPTRNPNPNPVRLRLRLRLRQRYACACACA